MTNKFKLLEKWSFENGITLFENDIIDVVSYGDESVCIGHPTFFNVIWIPRKEFDGICFPIAASSHRW